MDNENIRKIKQVLPSDLMARGISLESMGIHEYVWRGKDALAIIDILTKNRIPILGGDGYSYQDSEFRATVDGWYVKSRYDYESAEAFLKDSQRKAIEYIKMYTQKRGENYYFSFVVYTFPLGN